MIRPDVRDRYRALLASCAALLVMIAACGPTPSPSRSTDRPSSGPSSAPPSGPVATDAFSPTAYPKAAEAPCDETVAPDSAHGPYVGEIKRIVAPDRKTVVFSLCAPDVAFPVKIAAPAFGIQDSAWLEAKIDPKAGGPAAIVTDVNGTGPYLLDAWNLGSDVMLRRFENYWGEPAAAGQAIVRWADADGQRLTELQARTVDGADILETANVATAQADSDLEVMAREGMNTAYLGFNSKFAPFDDVKVRQAIALAIDRDALLKAAFPASSTVPTHVASCAIAFGCEGTAWPTYDPALAKETLTAAGFGSGFKTTIRYSDVARDYLPDPAAAAANVRDQLKANLGIDATLVETPLDQLVADAEAGKLDGIHLLGFRPRYPDMTAVLDPLFGAAASAEFGTKDVDLTATLTKAASTADPAKRTAAYAKANTRIAATVPMIPIAHVGTAAGFQADVDGAAASPMRLERFAAFDPQGRKQFVWMGAKEPTGLYCADETDVASQLVCTQLFDTLYAYPKDSAVPAPALATSCDPDPTLTEWTCHLRDGVVFHDGSSLDAADVVDTFAVQWDAANPRHKGRTGAFAQFGSIFGGFLNPPPTSGP